ncbi:MAG: pilus assembly protein PilM, partial [Nitrospirae bacterium]|nr:pilus assembly protein PilM [Nitrospirota bacterium]
IQNLLKCCEKAEVNVEDMVLQSLACGEAVLTSDEREMGVALIDIGGGTTEIAVYKDGCLRKGVVLSVGGNHFTNDISIGLRVPFHEAERIKRRHSSVLPELSLKDMAITQTNPVGYKGRKLKTEGDLFDFDIEVEAMDEQVRRMPLKYVTEIIQPRAEELLQLIKNEMRVFYDGGLSISNIVLTGGTSLLSGFDRMATAMLSLPVRIGYPKIHDYPVFNLNEQSDIKLKKEFNNPVYSTAIGMLLLESNRHSGKNAAASGMIYGITKKIKNWFDNITQPYIRRKRA